MAHDFDTIVRAATKGLPPDKLAQVQLGLSAAALFGVLERLKANTSYVGPASRLQPIYDQQLAKLRKVSGDEGAGEEPVQPEGGENFVASGDLEEEPDLDEPPAEEPRSREGR